MNIPEGHQAAMPYLMLDNAAGFIQFIKDVFDAEITQQSMRDGVVTDPFGNVWWITSVAG